MIASTEVSSHKEGVGYFSKLTYDCDVPTCPQQLQASHQKYLYLRSGVLKVKYVFSEDLICFSQTVSSTFFGGNFKINFLSYAPFSR